MSFGLEKSSGNALDKFHLMLACVAAMGYERADPYAPAFGFAQQIPKPAGESEAEIMEKGKYEQRYHQSVDLCKVCVSPA